MKLPNWLVATMTAAAAGVAALVVALPDNKTVQVVGAVVVAVIAALGIQKR